MNCTAPAPAAVATDVDPLYGVGVPHRQEVVFADGSSVWLLAVSHTGCPHTRGTPPDLFKRALGQDGKGGLVDLRDLVPELAVDLPVAETRDVPGIVHWSLRLNFGSAQALAMRLGQGTRAAA